MLYKIQSYTSSKTKSFEAITDRFKTATWLIIEVIGYFGLSLRKEIIQKCLQLAKKKDFQVSKSSLEKEIDFLKTIPEMLIVDKIKLPYSGIADVIQFDTLGVDVFDYMYNIHPVKSEAKALIEEYSSLEQGYSILTLAQCLKKQYYYKKIYTMNRRRPINVMINGQKTTYIPSLICVKKGETHYYNYIRSDYNNKCFRDKCNRMIQVSSTLRFVTPSRDFAAKLKPKIENWIRSVDVKEDLIKVIVYTYKSLINHNKPVIIYDLSLSVSPIIDNTKVKY